MSRIELAAPAALHVDPAGSDTLGDGSAANPFRQPQRAWDYAFAKLDLCGFGLDIQLKAAPVGQYNFYEGVNVSGRLPGQAGSAAPLVTGVGKPPFIVGKYAPVRLIGDPAYPLGAFIYPSANGGAAITLSEGAGLQAIGLAMDTSRSAQDCIDVFNNSFLDVANLRFGNAGNPGTTYSNHFSVAWGSTLYVSGAYEVSGGAMAHMNPGHAAIYFNNNGDPGLPITVTLLNNPNFSAGTILCDDSNVYAIAVNWVGSCTGRKALILRDGIVETNGAKNLPGSLPVELQSGGQYL